MARGCLERNQTEPQLPAEGRCSERKRTPKARLFVGIALDPQAALLKTVSSDSGEGDAALGGTIPHHRLRN